MSLIFEPTSLSNNWAPWLSLLLDFAVKGTAIILAAGLLIVALRRASAATRHLVLSLSIVSLLVLPPSPCFCQPGKSRYSRPRVLVTQALHLCLATTQSLLSQQRLRLWHNAQLKAGRQATPRQR